MGSNYFDSDEANKFIDKMDQKEYEFFNVLLNEEMLGGAGEPVEEILRNYFGETHGRIMG